MKRILGILATLLASTHSYADNGFEPLFNGKDLSGWKSILEETNSGRGAFSVDAETQSIHVYAQKEAGSEQGIDCLYTDKEYSNFILKLEYRWLEKRFEPRPTHDRDAGLLFHVHGDMSELWPNCIEMQLGESEVTKVKNRYATGDLWVIGKDVQVMNARDENDFYKPGSPLVPVGDKHKYEKSLIPEGNEKAHGEWNEITLTVRGGQEAIFELNGKVVNRIATMSYIVDDHRVPLAQGRIGLQAEYAELQYRSIRIKEFQDADFIAVHSMDDVVNEAVDILIEPAVVGAAVVANNE